MNFVAPNYYTRLGVSRLATTDEIRRAFRSLARVYHPDVAENKTFAEEVFKRLNEAYETLSDSTRRRAYDLEIARLTAPIPTVNPFHNRSAPSQSSYNPQRSAPPPPPPPRSNPYTTGGTAPPPPRPRTPPPMGSRFGGATRTASPPPPPPPQAPRHRVDLDIRAALEITLEDSVLGATYVVSVQQNDSQSRRQDLHTCRVHVPPRVYEGQILRLKGLGYVDTSDFAVGDLYLTIQLAKHPRYRVLNEHLFCEINITPWEAALGGRVRIHTLDGMADLHIPAGTQPGNRMRLAGYGLPQRNGGRGDLFVSLNLKMPPAASDKERELWRALAAQYSQRVR